MIPCRHWRACGVSNGGCCAIDAHDRPSFGVCLNVCKKYDGPSRSDLVDIYRHGVPIPSHHQPRHAHVLVNAPPTTAYIGDRIASGFARLGVNPCIGCDKRKQLLNKAHRGARRLVGLK